MQDEIHLLRPVRRPEINGNEEEGAVHFAVTLVHNHINL
jgi:hypothetical protein